MDPLAALYSVTYLDAAPLTDALARAERSSWLKDCEGAYDSVYRGIVAMGATPEDASDAVQEAFERALRQRDAKDRPAGWLFIVALRIWRRQRWRQRLFMPLAILRHAASSEGGTEDRLDLLEQIRKLPDRQRQVVVARYVLGLSQRETAELLGISAGTVASTTSQANRRLRESLGGLP